MNILFTGAQYLFFTSFAGLVAKADRKGYGLNEETFDVEYTEQIDMATIKRVINKAERQFIEDKKITYNENFVRGNIGLRYHVNVTLEKF